MTRETRAEPWRRLNDFERIRRFLRLAGRPYRPAPVPTRPRDPRERARLLALIPGFSFEPLAAILRALGRSLEDIWSAELDALQGSELAAEVLERCAAEPVAWAARLVAAHEGLVRERPPPTSPDLIAIPGSRTLSRAAAAFRIWDRGGRRARLAVSGGGPSYAEAEADAVPEAEAYAACMRVWGAPAEAIILEDQARSTAENAAFLGAAIAEEGGRRRRPVHLLVVTTGFHTSRALFSVRRLQGRHPDLASVSVAAAPSFHPETLALDEGGRSAQSKVAIVLNEYLKLHFEIARERA